VEANATTKTKGAAVDLSTEFADIGTITTIHFSSIEAHWSCRRTSGRKIVIGSRRLPPANKHHGNVGS
jgi:hypothetical protein